MYYEKLEKEYAKQLQEERKSNAVATLIIIVATFMLLALIVAVFIFVRRLV